MLPLTKPADGYLRLRFEGAANIAGVGVQTWDLSAIPASVRASEGFRRSVLVLARPLTAGLMDVGSAVSFISDANGIPTALALTITAGAAADEVALDVWCLHSVIGAVSDASYCYFIAPVGGAGAVASVFFEAETNGSDAGHRVRNVGSAGNFDFNFEVPSDFTTLVSLQMWGASRTVTNAAAPITLTSSFGVPPAGPAATSVALGIAPAFTTGQLFRYSIAGVFAALAANAQAAVNVNHGGIGGTIDYYGIMLEYT